jgi:dihydrofolate reductase
MLIGGAQLYAQGLAQAARLYLTRVELSPEGDAYFPEVDDAQWQLVEQDAHAATETTPAYSFETWLTRG